MQTFRKMSERRYRLGFYFDVFLMSLCVVIFYIILINNENKIDAVLLLIYCGLKVRL